MPFYSTGGPFGSIKPGESDHFTFDFTQRLGQTGTITSADWVCTLSEVVVEVPLDGQSEPYVVTDPDPQLRIISTSILGKTVQALCGNFIEGLSYTLTVTINVDDGRVLILAGEVDCEEPALATADCFTVEKFREDFPAFGDANRFTDHQIQYWINNACSPPNSTAALNPYRWGQFYYLGLELWVAHNLAIQDAQAQRVKGPGGTYSSGGTLLGAGVPASKSVNGVSISYDNQLGMEQNAGWWGATPWGNQFLYYLRLAGTAPIQLPGGDQVAPANLPYAYRGPYFGPLW